MNTIRTDWYFIIPSTLIWIAALVVTAWDFLYRQQAVYRFSLLSLAGAVLLVMGLSLRLVARRTCANISPTACACWNITNW